MLLFPIGDIIFFLDFILSLSISNAVWDILDFILANLLFFSCYYFYRNYNDRYLNKKLFLLVIVNILMFMVGFIIDILFVNQTQLYTTLTPQTITLLKPYFNHIYLIDGFELIDIILWFIFVYYYSLWFNKSFSIRYGTIDLLPVSVYIKGFGILIQVYYEISFYYFNKGLFTTNLLTSKEITAYNKFLGGSEIGYIFIIISDIFEMLACYLMYKRLTNVAKDKIKILKTTTTS